MPPFRPLRPTVRELATFLLDPQPQTIRCSSYLASNIRSSSRPVLKTTLPLSRSLSSPQRFSHSSAPRTRDRGPPSTETTQTDFGALDVLANTPAPSTSIDACLSDGFHLNNGIKITDGDGVLLVAGEAFTWRPWSALGGKAKGEKALINEKGQFEVADEAWGLFGVVWPKPDLLILGLGGQTRPLSPKTRQYLNSLGIRVDISDTRNAAAMFNLLATERGVGSVAAALIPIG